MVEYVMRILNLEKLIIKISTVYPNQGILIDLEFACIRIRIITVNGTDKIIHPIPIP